MTDSITRDAAILIARKKVAMPSLGAFRCTDERPAQAFYDTHPNEPRWYVWPPSESLRVGGDRLIVVSKLTGAILFDGVVGE